MKPVIVAEKPSQAKAYAEAFKTRKADGYIEVLPDSIFPAGAVITWGIGHLVELREPKSYDPKWGKWSLDALPILPESFQFQVAKGKYKQFSIIKKLLSQTDTVINACDVDREGSNIFYSIYHQTGCRNKTIRRLWINSLEIDEVRRGFASLQDNARDLLLYEEAKARQISDWLVGMNGSRLYSLLLQQKGLRDVFAIGRVQTPTLWLIYQREREIEAFKPEPFYEIEGLFKAADGSYKGKAKLKSNERKEAEDLLQKHGISNPATGVIQSVKTENKRTPPPMLHSLSTLQAAANRKWKASPQTVLSVMQGLYEKKLVTYPRTDAQHITPAEFAYLASGAEALQQVIGEPFPIRSKVPKKRFVDSSKVAEHYAIIPTKKIPSSRQLAGLSSLERNLYEEIVRTTLAMFHDDYRYAETKIITDVHALLFYTTGKTELDKGWKALFPVKEKQEEQPLPRLVEQESVDAAVAVKEGMTTAPKPYTEGQLISLMKTCGKYAEDPEDTAILKQIEGLGTEATRSGIIETIKRHNYIEVKKNIVSLTEKGRILCRAVEGNLLASPSMTAKWETYLKRIGNGEGSSENFLENTRKFIRKLMEEVPGQLQANGLPDKMAFSPSAKEEIALCPACGKGKIISIKGFYGCSEYANGCKQTFPAVFLKKRLTANQIRQLCEKGKTPVLKGFMSKNGKKFNAKLILENGKLKMEF
ncbi:type IA DNA topoisomerase [Planococcus lenghuensis]|uniref:DNA topoisomerase n=1 Tax=Planococcus lenghuensis TaxID=2213202 RepID=A0A1Q2L075_9BACL|nr:type IA DNA topoisomerase [Planococcus lenghuensis]AQQ53774.1 DNA topoisomerase III [Planococcus lenghuensis]